MAIKIRGDNNPSRQAGVGAKIAAAKWKGGYQAHLERTRSRKAIYDKKWQKENKILVSFYTKQYQRAKRGAEGSHSLEEWKSLITSYGGRCAGCSGIDKLEADHILPISKKGTNYIWNIQPLCRSCNARKHAKVPEYDY